MKAKEYAEDLENAIAMHGMEKAVNRTLSMMFKESKELIDARGVKTDEGLFGVFNELNDKWKAICRHVSSVQLHPDLFKDTLKALQPEVYNGWESNQRINKFIRSVRKL